MNRLIILQGVPAAGKSTWAREFVRGKKDWVIVNRDSIRNGRGDYWIPEQERYISDLEEYHITRALEMGLNVIIDATNLNPKTNAKWIQIAKQFSIEPEWKEFKISYQEAIERDSKRERPVGKGVIRDFFNKYYPNMICNMSDDRIIKMPQSELPYAVICDIDGTVSLRNNRSPFDYSKVCEDTFDPRMSEVLYTFVESGVKIIFITGREDVGDCKELTIKWLDENFKYCKGSWELIMRPNGDHRNDVDVKKEAYDKYIKDKYNVMCVFEDRDNVVKMWRDEGLLCNQVYYGNF